MKWLNKISRWFKAEYEIEEIIVEDNEQIDIESLREKGIKVTTEEESRFMKKGETGTEHRKEAVIHGEIDAKISYQYPKGNFRFPIIPDYEPSERRKSSVSAEPIVKPTYLEAKSVHIQTRQTSAPPIQEEERKRRPFSPTQIPSPVYGFQKRPNKMEEEREHIATKEASNDIPAIFRKGNEQRKQERDSFNQEGIHLSKPTDNNEKPSNTSEMIQKVAILPLQTKRDVEMEPSMAEGKKLDVTPIDADEVQQTNQELTEQPSHIDNHFLREEEPATNGHIMDQVKTESNDIPVAVDEKQKETEEFTSELSNAVQEESSQQSINGADEVDEDVEQESAEIVSMTSAHEEVAPALEVEEVKEVYNSPASPMESPKRKPVPFNVVMLRQDKLKMQNNQQQVEKKTEKIIEQTNEVVQSMQIEPDVIGEEEHQEELPYYHFPSIDLLSPPVISENDDEWLDQQGYMLNETLLNFNVRAKVVNITQGPAVTQFEVQPDPGVKVNKITNLTDDIKLCLAAQDIRMEAPIPGKHTIGIEIPNRKSRAVPLREILESSTFKESESPLTVALGLDITGSPVVTDLRKMPHGLIAGATGSGKSVCINTMLVSLLYKATPQDVKLLLIDPKVVELAPYNSIPHLVSPVITDVKAATAALKWAVEEMDRRYELFSHTGVRDLQRFNKKAEETGEYAKKLPYIVIIIDELADLMMMSPAEVEESICRIAQKARACGIHLVLATQRPSVDVITGLIKANIPTRIAFSVSSQVDSRTIIDTNGADKLLGRGDMLFLENGSSKTVRLQGTFVSDEEIEDVVDFVKKEQEPQYLFLQEDLLSKAQISDERDELFLEACEFVVYQNAASTSSLQRRFHIGYNRAARLMDMLESKGIISEARGSKPRDVLMNEFELQELLQAETEQGNLH